MGLFCYRSTFLVPSKISNAQWPNRLTRLVAEAGPRVGLGHARIIELTIVVVRYAVHTTDWRVLVRAIAPEVLTDTGIVDAYTPAFGMARVAVCHTVRPAYRNKQGRA